MALRRAMLCSLSLLLLYPCFSTANNESSSSPVTTTIDPSLTTMSTITERSVSSTNKVRMSEMALKYAVEVGTSNPICSFMLADFDAISKSIFMQKTSASVVPIAKSALDKDNSLCRVFIQRVADLRGGQKVLEEAQKELRHLSNVKFVLIMDNKEQDFIANLAEMTNMLLEIDFRNQMQVANVQNDLVTLHQWCPDQGLRSFLNVYVEGRFVRKDVQKNVCESALKNKRFNVSAIGNQPFIVYTETGEMTGSDVATLDIVAKKIGFEFDMVPEQMWGAPGPNGKWLGTVGAVYHGRSRVGMGHFNVDWFFTQVIEFSTTVCNLETRLIAPKPKPLSPFMNVVRPFTWLAWLLIVLSFVGVVSAFSLLRYVKVVGIEGKKWDKEYFAGPFLDCYQMQLSQSSGFRFVETRAGQFLLLMFLLYVFVILSSYECNLRAYLIAVDYEKPVDTMQDIVDLDRRLYLPLGTNFDSNLANSQLETSKIIYKAIVEENLFHGNDQGLLPIDFELELIENGDVILMSLDMKKAADPRIEARHGYQPYRVGDIVFPFVSGFVLPKYEPSNEDINVIIKALFESGIVNYLISSFIAPKALLPFVPEERVEEPFTMAHIGSMLTWIIFGLIVSCIVFAMEIYCCNSKEKGSTDNVGIIHNEDKNKNKALIGAKKD